jgi:hypothetical protein
MTPKSPEEQAAELYPVNKQMSNDERYERMLEQNAWLSRQAEVDALKNDIDNLINLHTEFKVNKEAEVDELKRQVEHWKDILKNLKHRINEHYGGGFTEEDIALVHYKQKSEELAAKLASKEKEIEEFAEWCGRNKWTCYTDADSNLWFNMVTYRESTTTELLKQFRDEKH